MQGTIRTYDDDVKEKIIKRVEHICKDIAKAMECKADVTIIRKYPAVINHPKETSHIKRLAIKWFGAQHFSEEDLPISASEDFSYFLQEKPGCFFALGTMKPGTEPRTLHSSDYDFNDDLVATGAYFWLRLVEDRLSVNLLQKK